MFKEFGALKNVSSIKGFDLTQSSSSSYSCKPVLKKGPIVQDKDEKKNIFSVNAQSVFANIQPQLLPKKHTVVQQMSSLSSSTQLSNSSSNQIYEDIPIIDEDESNLNIQTSVTCSFETAAEVLKIFGNQPLPNINTSIRTSNISKLFKRELIEGKQGVSYATVELPHGYSFTGQLLKGMCHGYGTLRSSVNGFAYRGQFAHGKAEGRGNLKLGNDWWYSGLFNGGVFHGSGTIHYADGRRLRATFEHGAFPKQANIIWPNGCHYFGSFNAEGFPHGDGLIVVGGNKLVVHFIDGKLTKKNGLIYADGRQEVVNNKTNNPTLNEILFAYSERYLPNTLKMMKKK